MTTAGRRARVFAAAAAALAVALAAAAGGAALRPASAEAAGAGAGAAASASTVAPAAAPAATGPAIVTRGPFERVLVLNGRLTAARSELLKVPVVSGWRTTVKWLAGEGTSVAPGDAVAQLDASSPAGDLVEQENRIEEKKQQLVILEADRQRADLDATSKVLAAQLAFDEARFEAAVPAEVIGERAYQERQLALGKARAGSDEARRAQAAERARLDADLAKARLELETLRERQERARGEVEAMTLRATTAGVVVHAEHPWFGRKVRVGENLQSTMTVVELPDPASLEIEAFVPESEAGDVRPGQPVTLRLDALPTRVLRGTVAEVAARGEQRPEWGRAFYFRARIALEALDPAVMRPGMSVQCAVEVFRAADVLRVPLAAAARRGEAFVVRPRGREAVGLKPLAVNESFVAVAPGAAPGAASGAAPGAAPGTPGLAEGDVLEPSGA